MKNWPLKYRVLDKNIFILDEYSLVPIRYKDRYRIMNWRNDQIFHLRQKEKLKKKEQDDYFQRVIYKEFKREDPDQILFSFLEQQTCIGYGGLVHIDWKNKNTELSFVLNTELEDQFFVKYWEIYLCLIKQITFKYLDFHKIFTYAFDLRPKLYEVLKTSGFILEGRLIDHISKKDSFCDVLIHSCINPIHYLNQREVNSNDSNQLFLWRNEKSNRKSALDSKKIDLFTHTKWFKKKLSDNNCKILIFESKQGHPVGQIRFEKTKEKWIIDYSVDKYFRGLGLGNIILKKSISKFKSGEFQAEVKKENKASIKTFIRIGFNQIIVNKDSLIFEFII